MKFILAAVFSAAFAITAFSINVNAATFVVNTASDTQDAAPGNGVCADGGGACSLRAAITEANALAGADTITVPAGTYTTTIAGTNENANADGDFDITSPLTINGAGGGATIIQANASIQTANERVFHILAGGTAVTIAGVTVQNGVNRFATAIGGGGIRVEGATANLTLNDSTVTGNYSESRGGGVSANKANLTINGCIFNNNQAGSGVAGSGASGGAIAIDSEDNVAAAGQTASITNTIINSNRAESSVSNTFGGGITIRALNATVNITGSTISNNFSNAVGGFVGFAGGILNQQVATTITGSTVSGNTSSRFHAGIRNLSSTSTGSTLNLVNSTVSGNTATIADSVGGGIANVSGAGFAAVLNITGSTISGNSLTGTASVGGGLANTGTSTGAAQMNLLNSTVSGNSAHDAAGIYTDGSAAATVLDFSTVAANSAVGEGGGLYQDVAGTTTLKDTIVADNSAPTAPDISGTMNSQNYNHIENATGGVLVSAANDVTGSDPQLGPLQDNGGPTLTHRPNFPATPVLNTIPFGTNGCGTTVHNDQRGTIYFRPNDNGCEKGSVEYDHDATPTATATPTGTTTTTSTPTATATPAASPVISGTVTYGNAISGPTPPRSVSNVLLSGAGSVPVSTVTGFPDGTYALSGFGSGSYTVTPSKSGASNGSITSFDAARIAQHAAGVPPLLTGNQLIVADVSSNGTISSFDAAEVAKFVVGSPPFGSTSNWIFSPVNRTYIAVNSSFTGQDYSALLMGEVSGNWTNSGARTVVSSQSVASRPWPMVGNDSRETNQSISIKAPDLATKAGRAIIVPISVKGVANKGIIAYEFDLRYDPSVLMPLSSVVDLAGTVSRGFLFAVNVQESGLLRVAVYGTAPLERNGVLLNLRFTAVGASNSMAPLTFERFMLNEDRVM
jgi:CSLREA domain-containing protein